MFKNILLAVDGSELSEKAVDYAINAITESSETMITILFVQQPMSALTVGTAYATGAYQEVFISPAEETPAFSAWQRFPDKNRVTYLTEVGNPAEVICAKAEEDGCDLIVLGSQGHGLVSSVFLGSVSGKVLHYAKCPVLVVR
ncbi:universal stress protein [Brevibacillus migulae]|uniref:universal stress protein n=1 Tax=Brevibacillus migulae TaxID=1644114 RepID=UPI00106DF57F|nr:universal stress protein [Brevibacillus migulae]